MGRFGEIEITKELNGTQINRLENIMMMGVDMHTYFDQLSIWLEEEPVRYYVRRDE
jgi:hypothetical protein